VQTLPSRAAGRRALTIAALTLAGTLPLAVWADAPLQHQELAAALRQVQALQRLIETSAAATPIEPGQRYHFDYPRLLADLGRVQTGLRDYLAPSRAQPRDMQELAGQYRFESNAGDKGATPSPGKRP
jgi:RAQPRD family integrative conjugative element protein